MHDNLWGTLSDTAYQCDTEGGSSGSPVIARSSNRALALHHVTYGSCLNGGVQFAYIWPQVSSFFGGVVPAGDNEGGGGNTPPVANFSFATSGLTATFTDSSSDAGGSITARLWTFGDGSTSTVTNPVKTYTAAGTYSVSLKVTDNGGLSTTTTKSVTVSSTANNPPVANFSFTTSGLTATFTDSSTDAGGSIASRSWNFGDGSTSTLANPSKTYAAAGTYSVVLTVTDNGGLTNTVAKSVVVSSTGGAFFQNLADYAINDNSTVDSPITVTGVAGNAPATLKVAVRIIHTFPSDVRV
ncbi:MAG: PKD domain-containing protein, partial [Xanthomonadaceae bacterium]|nr:PKD domain-containing protein [Xanthomonadaceae bacterium]